MLKEKSECPTCLQPAWHNEVRKNTQLAAVVLAYHSLCAIARGSNTASEESRPTRAIPHTRAGTDGHARRSAAEREHNSHGQANSSHAGGTTYPPRRCTKPAEPRIKRQKQKSPVTSEGAKVAHKRPAAVVGMSCLLCSARLGIVQPTRLAHVRSPRRASRCGQTSM